MRIQRVVTLLGAILLGTITATDDFGAEPAQKKGSGKDPRPGDDTSHVAPARSPDKVTAFKQTPQGELKAHIYFPAGWSARDRRPAIVFWSGGGFRDGAVGQFLSQAEYFASRGLVAICAEYRGRLSHKIELDACAEDARSAMRWVKGRASELGIDPAKVIASGGSAGGTLSFLVAREKGPDATGEDLGISTRPCALVLFNPAVGEHVLRVVGYGGPGQAAVNADIIALNTPRKDEPPVIMFYGTEDAFLATAAEFHRKAKAQGSRCELWIADQMRHGFFNRPPWHGATLRKADEFLVSLGRLQASSSLKENPMAVLTLARQSE